MLLRRAAMYNLMWVCRWIGLFEWEHKTAVEHLPDDEDDHLES